MLYNSVPEVKSGKEGEATGAASASAQSSQNYHSIPEKMSAQETVQYENRIAEKPSAPIAQPAPAPSNTTPILQHEVVRQETLEAIPVGEVIVSETLFTPMNLADAYALHFALGFFGGVHFKMGRGLMGSIYLFTFGCLGFGWVVDLFRMPFLVSEYNAKRGDLANNESEMMLTGDCYAMMVLNLLFGACHFYTRRHSWGLAALCTINFFGVGFLVDLFRFNSMVKASRDSKDLSDYSLLDAYICWFPLGLFGAHHFYLKKYSTGCLYFFTIGLLSFGWLADGFKIKQMVKEARTAEIVRNAQYAH